MADVDPRLVREIADRVMAELSRAQPIRADVKPTAGVCTGDYSKFKDRPDLQQVSGNASPGEPRRHEPAPPPSAAVEPTESVSTAQQARPPALDGFITARRIDQVKGSTVYLAAKGKLTPLAADRIKERGLTVERIGGAVAGGAKTGSVNAPWMWWIDGQCPSVATITDEAGDRFTQLASTHPLHEALMQMARRIGRGEVAGGLVFVRSAAVAACLANRCGNLRAMVGTCAEGVEQGVGELAPNMLVVEYPYHDANRLRAMIQRFVNGSRAATPTLNRHLEELRQCGSRG